MTRIPDVEPRALVGNAADAGQVQYAAGKEKRGRERDREDLRRVLAEAHGRRVFWKLLGFCGITETVRGVNDSDTNYRAGRHDVGLHIQGLIVQADEESLFTMMREAQREKQNG